jgi:hypothetical protein
LGSACAGGTAGAVGGAAGGGALATQSSGGGGGGGGWYGGGGGESGTASTSEEAGGAGGGGSSYATGTASSTTAGSRPNAGNNTDYAYQAGVGVGGASTTAAHTVGTAGGDGLVVITYTAAENSYVAVTATTTLLSKSGGTGGGYKLYIEADGDLCFAIDDDSTWGPEDTVCTSGTNYYNTNQWNHVIVQKDGTNGIYLYVNDPDTPVASDVSLTASGNLTNNQPLYLGADVQGTYSPYTGSIDEFRMYRALLTQNQRNRLYDLGNTTRISTTVNSNDSLNNGLVAHWTFDGKDMDWSSTTAEVLDRSGYGNHGNASTTLTQAYTVPGVLGQALHLDFSDAGRTVIAPDSSSLDFGTSTPFTISTWVSANPRWGKAGNILFMKGFETGSATEGGWYVIASTSGAMQFDLTNDMWNDYCEITATTDIYDNKMHHVTVVVYRNNSCTTNDILFFVDGVRDTTSVRLSTATTSVNITNNDPFVIGAYNDSSSQNGFWDGVIDDVRVYNRALSTDEVKRLYQTGKTTRVGVTIPNVSLDTGLVGHWTFNGPDVDWSSTTAEIRDTSGYGNHANATTSSMSSSTVPGTIGQALKFGSGAWSVSQVPYSATMQPTSAISYGGWFKFNATTSTRYLLSQQARQTPFTGWILEIYNSRLGATIHTATTWHSASTSTVHW